MTSHPASDVRTAEVVVFRNHYRIVGTSGRIAGTWHVLLDPLRNDRAWVTPHDVVIYDEHGDSGVVLYGNAFTASITEGVVNIGHVTRWDADVNEVRAELETLLQRIAAAAWVDTRNAD